MNAKIEKEVVFGMVKGIKTISDLFMPVAGVIVALNPGLEKSPELVNRDPHGSWMVKVLLGSPVQIEFLLTNKEYIDLLGAAYSAPVYPKI